MKSGSITSISWISYMVMTKPDGICVEQSVRAQRRIYVNWPAAEIYGVWIEKDQPYSVKRCCFMDTTVQDGDLEYGVLGSKLHTTVYRGFAGTAQKNGAWNWNVTGQVLAGKTPVPVGSEASWLATPDCAITTKSCRTYNLVVYNSKAPMTLKWTSDLTPQFATKAGGKPNEFVVESGQKMTFQFLSKSGKLKPDSIRLSTVDGNQTVMKPVANVAWTPFN